MGNNVTLIPKQPARHSLLTNVENVVYMPLASRYSHGIVKIGNGLDITTDGVLSVDFSSEWYKTVKEDVDVLKLDVDELQTDVDEIITDVSDIDDRLTDVENGTKLIAVYQTKQDNGLVTVNKTVVGGINELKDHTQLNANNIQNITSDVQNVKLNYATIKYVDNLYSKISVGGNNSYVFETREQFIEWLDGVFVRDDSFKPELLKIGDVIFIEETGVPDYWVKSKSSPMTINDFREYEAKIDVPEVKIDNVSISKNALDELQTIAIKNGRLRIGNTVHTSDFTGWTELSEVQFRELVEYGSIEIDGKIITFSENDVYVTPDTSYSIKQGKTAPTTETEGVIGEFYLDTTAKKLYQCVDKVDNSYEWKVIGDIDLTDYVKSTDYAQQNKGGVVRIGLYGISNFHDGIIGVTEPSESQIDAKTSYRAVTLRTLDYATKVGITTNTIALTEEEKAAAQRWLGIESGGGGVSQEDFDKLVNNKTQIKNSTLNGFMAGGSSGGNGNLVAIGPLSSTYGPSAVAIGDHAEAGSYAVALGRYAEATGWNIQLGQGINNKEKSLQVFDDNVYDAENHTLTVQNIELNSVNLDTRISIIETTVTDLVPDVARALKIPMATPIELQLIGVNTINEQEMISLGDGLTFENGVLSASAGGKYVHNIYLGLSDEGGVSTQIINTTSTEYTTLDEIRNAIVEMGLHTQAYLNATGLYVSSVDAVPSGAVIGIKADEYNITIKVYNPNPSETVDIYYTTTIPSASVSDVIT